jgi:6,7-dimethyl-8-ribityllumazine synthase
MGSKGMRSTNPGAGPPSAAGLQLAIVASRFNAEIVDRLIAGAMEAHSNCGGDPGDVLLVRVPGAFEIPLAVQRAADSKKFDGIIAIGCVIRGETPHFEHISRYATDGIGRVSLEHRIPVGFGILTVDTDKQALARSGLGENNKGFEAAMATVEMAGLLKKL